MNRHPFYCLCSLCLKYKKQLFFSVFHIVLVILIIYQTIITFILPTEIGKVRIISGITPEAIKTALARMDVDSLSK